MNSRRTCIYGVLVMLSIDIAKSPVHHFTLFKNQKAEEGEGLRSMSTQKMQATN